MPTGYTAAVQDGEITELKDFAYQCARAFGALIMMRDDPVNAPIPKEFQPSMYNQERLEETQEELRELRRMTSAERNEKAKEEFEDEVRRYQEHIEKALTYKTRYEAMLNKVKAWRNPPEGIRDFMIEQLETSIKHDCDTTYYHNNMPKGAKSGDEWFKEREERLEKDLIYHAKAQQEEINRTNGRNDWLYVLRRSLGDVEETGSKQS